MLILRAVSFFVLWAIVLLLVFSEFILGSVIFISLIGILAQWEFYQMQAQKGLKLFSRAGIVCGALYFLFSYLHLVRNIGNHDMWASLKLLILLIVIIGAVSRQVFEPNQQNAVVTVALTLLGFFYVPYLFEFTFKLIFWNNQPSVGFYLLIYLIAVTKLTDVGAYLMGRLLGRTPFMPKISPKKTWEGVLGGLLIAMLSSWAIATLMPNKLSLVLNPLILGLIIGIGSVIGDLAESVIKRDSSSKDSGAIIPGIGGALDLIDSLLFTAPFFYCYLIFASRLS